MALPNIDITNVSTKKISSVTGKDISTISFVSDQDLTDWEARADSSGRGAGSLIDTAQNTLYTWDKWDSSNLTWDNISKTWDDLTIILKGSLNLIETNKDLSDTIAESPAWDTVKNPYGVYPHYWSAGYNGGVPSPTLGYHAHLNPTAGANGGPALEFIDLNTDIGYPHRWLGFARSFVSDMSTIGWVVGTRIMITMDVKTDTVGKYASAGIYHQDATSGSNTFGNTQTSLKPSTVNEWETLSFIVTIDSSWKLTSSCTLYVYGQYGPEGTVWVNNVSIRTLNEFQLDVNNNEFTWGNKVYRVDIYGRNLNGDWSDRIPKQIRYIRDWLHGSTSNTANHWVEIQAIDFAGTNAASSKTVTCSTNYGSADPTLITDGNTASNPYFGVGAGLVNVVVDLGATYEIDSLKIWHYYADGRTYYGTKTEVSVDGTNWEVVFDSDNSGTYKEVSGGQSYKL